MELWVGMKEAYLYHVMLLSQKPDPMERLVIHFDQDLCKCVEYICFLNFVYSIVMPLSFEVLTSMGYFFFLLHSLSFFGSCFFGMAPFIFSPFFGIMLLWHGIFYFLSFFGSCFFGMASFISLIFLHNPYFSF